MTQTSTTYALVTPSYWKDAEKCRFLLETVERWVPPHIKHYLIVTKRDLPLFRPMLSRRNSLLIVEDIIPSWLLQVPGLRHFWISLRSRPVRNWILQQIVKLSAPNVIQEDVLIYADSDMFFIAPFDPASFEQGGKVPLFAEPGQRGLLPMHDKWQVICSALLGIPPESNFDINYVGQLIWWRRQNALAALARVEQTTGKPWPQAIAQLSGFSEYILYGIHADRILSVNANHWHDEIIRTLCYWRTTPLNMHDLLALREKRKAYHHSAMISAKSGTSMTDVRRAFA